MEKIVLFILTLILGMVCSAQNQNIVIDNNFPYYVNQETLGRNTIGGDTIFVASSRTKPLRFQFTKGDAQKPLVIINQGGQVKISSPNSYTWGAITFENCRYIKISGAGHPNYKYGFQLSADECGLAFAELSSDCEAEFIKISHDGFFGITAKKNYDGNPPFPYPVFENLIIHDCFIENVSEGMYLGETMSPGMEFKHVKIYNNIVRNTLRESIQIANMVEDVEIYNNTMLNAGLENLIYHTNILQIGNNSVVNAYNNILIGAPSTGIIVLGKGNCTFTNNYLASNLGIFTDNRSISDSLAPVDIIHNYFKDMRDSQIVKNYNEINYITAKDNIYETPVPFFFNQTDNSSNFTVTNNQLKTVPELKFKDPSSNDYSLSEDNPIEYKNMGAPGGPEYFETESKQIIVTSEMITDEVVGGSENMPLFLFDEQYLDVLNDEHAVSNSWIPDSNMTELAYHAVIDLGKYYYISEVDLHKMNGGNITIEYSHDLNWYTLFVDSNESHNNWSNHELDITTRFLRISMYDHVFAAVNEVMIYGYSVVKESEQIYVNPSMITDLVSEGSVNSPNFLFDEQSLNIQNGEHALSDSWKPYFSNINAPYYAVVDLGQDYFISEIDIHDMNDSYDFKIEYGEPNNWKTLVINPLDRYKFWHKHLTDISTRYLRLSMTEPFAAVNEILIYGYHIVSDISEIHEVASIEEIPSIRKNNKSKQIELYPNPVGQVLYIKFPSNLFGKNRLVINDILGSRLYEKEFFISDDNSILELSYSSLPNISGLYTLSVFYESGQFETIKFIKD